MSETIVVRRSFADGRAGWVQLIEGELTVNGETLRSGDGASISHATRARLTATKPAHFLFFDLR